MSTCENRVLAELEKGPKTRAELVAAVYGYGGPDAADACVKAFVHRLRKRGKKIRRESIYILE